MTKNISKLILFVSLISIPAKTAWGAARNELQVATTNHGGILFCSQLHNAIVHGEIDKIKQLLEENPNLYDQKNKQGDNLLHTAIINNQPDMAQYLILQYPDLIYQKNITHCSPLFTAISHEDLNTVKSILTIDPTLLNEETPDGFYPFYVAASDGNLNLVKYMLEMDHTLIHRKRKKTGAIALHGAAAMGRLNVVQYLSEINPRLLNEKTNDGLTPLHLAAQCKYNLATVKYILTINPTSITQTDDNGSIPLHNAARNNCIDIFQYMLEIDSTLLDHKTNDGLTMLQYVARELDNKAINLICLILQKRPFIDFRAKDNSDTNIIRPGFNSANKVALINTLKNHLLQLHQDYPADQHIQCAVCMEAATECPSCCQDIAEHVERIHLLPCCLNILCEHDFALMTASSNPCPYCRKPLV